MIRSFSIALILLCLFTATSLKEKSFTLTYTNNEMGYDMFRILSKGKENFSFSPFSISSALLMTYLGADGITQKEMSEVLYLQNAEIDGEFYTADYHSSGLPVNLYVANGAWLEKRYPVNEVFKNKISNNFHAKIENVDFITNYESERKNINSWIEEITKKNIPDLLPPSSLNSNTRFVLCNAIYFNETWESPFSPTRTTTADFTTPTKKVSTKFMNHVLNSSYYEDENIKVALIPYRFKTFDMVIILPQEGKTLADVEKIMTEEYMRKVFTMKTSLNGTGLKNVQLSLSLPKFTVSLNGSIKEQLQTLGMKDAFNVPTANFSKINSANNLFISDVFHASKVIVDEKGTEASAATAVVGEERCGPPSTKVHLVVDKPFIFMIRSAETKTNFFMGKVTDPTKQ